jgi:hypothetical protein
MDAKITVGTKIRMTRKVTNWGSCGHGTINTIVRISGERYGGEVTYRMQDGEIATCLMDEVIRRLRDGDGEIVQEDEHTRMMKFFFGRGPTDPSKLPPAPRALGRSWDDLADG